MSKAELYAALAAAQGEAKAVAKASENQHHRYRYASAEDMIAESAVLSKHGLAFLPMTYRLEAKDGLLVQVCDYILTHASGEHLLVSSETPVIPGKGRPEDKACATAKTYDLGYMLRGVLKVPRGEQDANVDGRDDSGYVPLDNPFERAKRELGRELFAKTVQCSSDEVDHWGPANEFESRTKLAALRKEYAVREARRKKSAS